MPKNKQEATRRASPKNVEKGGTPLPAAITQELIIIQIALML